MYSMGIQLQVTRKNGSKTIHSFILNNSSQSAGISHVTLMITHCNSLPAISTYPPVLFTDDNQDSGKTT